MSSQAQIPSRSSFPVVVAVVLLFALFIFLTSKVYVDRQETATAPAPVDRPSLAEHQGKAEQLLQSTKVLDAANGKVRLDINRAKELVIAEHSE